MPKRVDLSHSEIREALRNVGFYVHDTAKLGSGFPDLVVVDPYSGRVWFIEVKTDGGRFTAPEIEFLVAITPRIYRVYNDPDKAVQSMMEESRKSKA